MESEASVVDVELIISIRRFVLKTELIRNPYAIEFSVMGKMSLVIGSYL